MLSTHRPWFFSESLRVQFSRDIDDALDVGRINAEQFRWLELLLLESHGEAVTPRVDQLLRDDAALKSAELAGALLISDDTGKTADVYLSTALYGLERFANRQLLMAELTARLTEHTGDLATLEYRRIDGDLFEPLTLAIIDQHVWQLQQLTERLQRMPALHEAVGQTLQQKLNEQWPDTAINVFTHLVQIKQAAGATPNDITLTSQTLVEAALCALANQPLAAGLHHQWLDHEGIELTADQARLWQQAVSGVSDGLMAVYESLLGDYWGALAADGMTHRELICQAVAERFRHHMLQARHDGVLSASEFAALQLLFLPGNGWTAELQVSRLSIQIGSQGPVKLAGIFLLDFTSGQLPNLLLYSAQKGLQRFTRLDAVAEHFANINGRTQLFNYASFNDHASLRVQQALHVRLDRVDKTPFSNIAESVIGLQKRNLADVLKRSFKSPAEAAVTVNGVLDIAVLIDPRLNVAHEAVRWNDALASSEHNWSAFSSPSRVAALRIPVGKVIGKEAMLPWAGYLRDARIRLDSICDTRPSVTDCAHNVLNRYFSVLQDGAVDARRLWFREEEDGVVGLSEMLMEQISGYRDAKVPHDCEVYLDPLDSAYSQHLAWLTPQLLDHVMGRARQVFAQEYARQIWAFHDQHLRITGSSVTPANASRHIREGLLRLELNMQRNTNKVSDHGLDMLQQVLDRPVFKLREAFGYEATEVFIPVLVYDNSQPAVALTNVVVLQQPLNGACKPLLWSAVLGLQEFESLSELKLHLNAWLAFPGSRQRWLDLIAAPAQEKIERFLMQSDTPRLMVNLVRVEENFLAHMETDELQRRYQGIEWTYRTALSWQADARQFEDMMTLMALDDNARTAIEMLSSRLELSLLSGEIPAWLQAASTHDLTVFRQLLVRFWQRYMSREEILTVASLGEYSADQLRQRLQQDFPAVQLDPDLISITLTRYVAPLVTSGDVPSSIPAATSVISESLSRYAINRFSRFQDASLSVSSEDATRLPDALDARYIRELVRTLDIGAGYQQYLTQTFSETDPEYSARLDQLIQQTPSALQLVAFRLKLQGELSNAAYDFIANVISMPDGLARLPVNGQMIGFSELKLVCAEGYAPDVVAGVFVIAPTRQAQGPWILHATADADYFFKEYASQSEFLNDLQTSAKLQAMVLERLDPAVRFVYERDGFIQPHLSWATGGFTELSGARPGPVQLRVEPLQESVLHCLFRAAQQVMLITARERSVTSAQADSAESHFLMLLGAEQVLMFLPGRPGGLVGLWQAQQLLHSSLDSASEDKWGKALAEFASALAVLLVSRDQPEESATSQPSHPSEVEGEEGPRWHDPQLQFDLNARLQQFEAHDVSLSNLQRDPSLNVFSSAVSLKQYAAVSGKVYQVRRGEHGWCVMAGDNEGPRIRLDADKRWVLDTELGQRRDGGALTRLRTTRADMDVNDIFLVDARGMHEIQRLYPRKAAQIVEAHEKARQYLENTLNNLTIAAPQTALDPRTVHILKEFFGVGALSNVSIGPIRKVFADIYWLLQDPKFSPHSSELYVVGTSKLGYEDMTAFNFANDPLHRIFLSERYFITPYARLKRGLQRQGSFNFGSHFRASILIHELSHIANGTSDLAYVDSTAPFLDLLEDNGTYRARLKLEHQKAQNNLSHRTPREELFRMEDGGLWRDLKTNDNDAKRTILKLTGTDNLEAARDKFLHDTEVRSRLILSNADSVSLLATLLGRERFVPAP